MTEEENQGVEEEILQGDPQTTDTDVERDDASDDSQESSQSKRNDAEYNWAEMRRQRERDRQELEELRASINQLKPQKKEEEDDYGVNDDDLLEGRHLKELKRELKQLKSELKAKESSSLPERLQSKFPDFYELMTVDNLNYLDKEEPELAKALAQNPDEYQRAVGAYKLLKRLKGNSPQAAIDKKKAIENSKKPVSVNSVSKQSALGNVQHFENGLSPELKKQYWKEMQQAMKMG